MNEVIVNGVTYIEKPQVSEELVIVRGDRSGVFFGEIQKEEGKEVTLINCRRLWYWSGSASLSQLAVDGVKNPSNCKFPVAVSKIIIKDVIEIIPCTKKAIDSIHAVPIWSV